MDKLSPVPLYIQLKDDLMETIQQGHWSVEQQIPTEQELMQEFNVGRETVRKAISLLVQKGYLYKKRGIGTFVASNAPAISMEPLISLSFFLKSRGYKEKNKVLNNKAVIMNDELIEDTKMPREKNIHFVNRLRYIDNKPIALEYAYFIDQNQLAGEYDFEQSIITFLFKREKIKISKVDQTIILRKPSKEEIDYLKMDDGDNVLEMQRWLYVKGFDQVYFYVKIIMVADLYSYWTH